MIDQKLLTEAALAELNSQIDNRPPELDDDLPIEAWNETIHALINLIERGLVKVTRHESGEFMYAASDEARALMANEQGRLQ